MPTHHKSGKFSGALIIRLAKAKAKQPQIESNITKLITDSNLFGTSIGSTFFEADLGGELTDFLAKGLHKTVWMQAMKNKVDKVMVGVANPSFCRRGNMEKVEIVKNHTQIVGVNWVHVVKPEKVSYS